MELPKYVYATLAAIALFILLKDDLKLAWDTIKFRRAWRRTALQIIHEMDERNTEWRVHVDAGTPSAPFHVQRKAPRVGDIVQQWEWWTVQMFADPKGQGRKILTDALELRNKAHAKDGKMRVSKFVNNINSYIRFDKKFGKMDPSVAREFEELADEMIEAND